MGSPKSVGVIPLFFWIKNCKVLSKKEPLYESLHRNFHTDKDCREVCSFFGRILFRNVYSSHGASLLIKEVNHNGYNDEVNKRKWEQYFPSKIH